MKFVITVYGDFMYDVVGYRGSEGPAYEGKSIMAGATVGGVSKFFYYKAWFMYVKDAAVVINYDYN